MNSRPNSTTEERVPPKSAASRRHRESGSTRYPNRSNYKVDCYNLQLNSPTSKKMETKMNKKNVKEIKVVESGRRPVAVAMTSSIATRCDQSSPPGRHPSPTSSPSFCSSNRRPVVASPPSTSSPSSFPPQPQCRDVTGRSRQAAVVASTSLRDSVLSKNCRKHPLITGYHVAVCSCA